MARHVPGDTDCVEDTLAVQEDPVHFLKMATTSFRPEEIDTWKSSWLGH
jgi:hypothetical protein